MDHLYVRVWNISELRVYILGPTYPIYLVSPSYWNTLVAMIQHLYYQNSYTENCHVTL